MSPPRTIPNRQPRCSTSSLPAEEEKVVIVIKEEILDADLSPNRSHPSTRPCPNLPTSFSSSSVSAITNVISQSKCKLPQGQSLRPHLNFKLKQEEEEEGINGDCGTGCTCAECRGEVFIKGDPADDDFNEQPPQTLAPVVTLNKVKVEVKEEESEDSQIRVCNLF